MIELIILVGNIGSGKSTTVKKLVKEGYIVISRDAFRYMIGAGEYIFNPKLEPIIHNMNIDCLIRCLQVGLDVVVDETNVSRGMRKRYLELGNDYGYITTALVMPRLSMKEAVDRRMNDPHGQPDRKMWEGVWKKFESKYCEPTIEEGFNKVIKSGYHNICSLYPTPDEETCVCGGGSDISGGEPCTKEDERNCPWAKIP